VAIIALVVVATVAVQIHMLRDAVNAHADERLRACPKEILQNVFICCIRFLFVIKKHNH